ncbi:MAG: membrane dipeptidase [Pyrinomonadaceae bacterium]|nr:membrane dipeptidase [Pyrinomonadaceae bacterium]
MYLRKVFCYSAICLLCVSLVTASLARDTNTKRQTQTNNSDSSPRDEKLWKKALEIHRKAIVVDTHNDILSMMTDDNYDLGVSSVGKYHTDIARMQQGGLTAEFFSVYIDRSFVRDGGSARRTLDMIDYVYRAVERHPNDLMMAYSTADIRRAKKQNKIAALMGIEGGHAIEDSLMALRDFYRLGIRYMTLTHNNTNNWADSCCDEAKHSGLSDFGKEVVREMNRIGMLVDVSHVSDKTMSDVLDISTAPVIASHSSARALGDRPRNIPDDRLRRIAKNGGVVMVNFYPGFIDKNVIAASKERDVRLKPQMDELRETYKDDGKRLGEEINKLLGANPLPATPLSVLIDHFDHIAKVAGIDHVGIGSDFDGVPNLPVGMEDISKLPNITYELLKRGYREKEVKKVLGDNFMRAFAQAEAVAETSSKRLSGDGSVKRIIVVKK